MKKKEEEKQSSQYSNEYQINFNHEQNNQNTNHEQNNSHFHFGT